MPKPKYETVVDGLKAVYRNKIRPIEETYDFPTFNSPPLTDVDIESKPFVLLLGQYSTGKSTFIKTLLGKNYPGIHIGPEPTTDRFVAVMHGTDERVIPGNAAAVQNDKPFQQLVQFGNNFLGKFQVSLMPSALLENVSFVDTPGVLSGEKQRLGRSYDFATVCQWYAERSDMILLLFDAHKLDISDEFKRVIHSLKGHDEKIRVVLNKCDMISTQQLMRVYGALMWSLGKVIRTPEVVRVFIGSFWDQELTNEHSELLKIEQKDLIDELLSLPRNSATRKINEIVKRARKAKVHGLIISHLRSEMPMFKKQKKQKELLDNLDKEFTKIQVKFNLAPGDFPEIESFKEKLELIDFSNLPKMQAKLFSNLDDALSVELPNLMQQFPPKPTFVFTKHSNPFDDRQVFSLGQDEMWMFSSVNTEEYYSVFDNSKLVDGKLNGTDARQVFVESGLPMDVLAHIWGLVDQKGRGYLERDQFAIAMHLIYLKLNGQPVPEVLPETLLKPIQVE